MKNRILWIFEEQDAQQGADAINSFVAPENAQNVISQDEIEQNFATVPAALLGELDGSGRETLTRIYRKAYARTQEQRGARSQERAQFERLLDDVCLDSLTAED